MRLFYVWEDNKFNIRHSFMLFVCIQSIKYNERDSKEKTNSWEPNNIDY